MNIIGNWAFAQCIDLMSIEIPNNVTSIGNHVFFNCDKLQNIEIPDSVSIIGKYAFYHCNSLKNATIGKNVTSLGQYAFSECHSLRNVYYKGDVPVKMDHNWESNGIYYQTTMKITSHYPEGNETWKNVIVNGMWEYNETSPWNP